MTRIPNRYGSRRHQGGFTMVELIVVMVLIGILAAIGAGRYFDRESFDAQAFTDQTRTLLRYAQKAAIARNTPVWVELGDNRIALCHVEPHGACPPESRVQLPIGGATSTATESYCQAPNWFCIGRPDGVRIQVSQAINQFRFDALGRPTDASRPIAGLTVTISGDGQDRNVTVSQETGYVH